MSLEMIELIKTKRFCGPWSSLWEVSLRCQSIGTCIFGKRRRPAALLHRPHLKAQTLRVGQVVQRRIVPNSMYHQHNHLIGVSRSYMKITTSFALALMLTFGVATGANTSDCSVGK